MMPTRRTWSPLRAFDELAVILISSCDSVPRLRLPQPGALPDPTGCSEPPGHGPLVKTGSLVGASLIDARRRCPRGQRWCSSKRAPVSPRGPRAFRFGARPDCARETTPKPRAASREKRCQRPLPPRDDAARHSQTAARRARRLTRHDTKQTPGTAPAAHGLDAASRGVRATARRQPPGGTDLFSRRPARQQPPPSRARPPAR